MAVVYYGSRISDHITTTPEGYLVCHDVPIARIGVQRYLGRETPDPNADPERVIPVERPEEEVFSKEAIASFEGKPVTNDHPPEDITTQNVSVYMKGVAKDVRQGTGEFKDCLVADLVIYDPMLVQSVRDGKREISCGYDCLWVPDGNRFIQRNIRGNHIAVVDKGRAGARVSIHDAKPKGDKHMSKKGLIGRILASFSKDAEPEELAEASRILRTADEEPAFPPKQEEQPARDEDNGVAALAAQVAALAKKVDALTAAKDEVPQPAPVEEPDALDALEGELQSVPEQEKQLEQPAEDVQDELPPAPEEEKPKNPITQNVRDAALQTIRNMKPVIAGIKDKAQRKAASDSLAALIRGHVQDAQYGTVLKASRQKQTRDAAMDDARQLGKQWMEKYNPHYKK